MFYGLNDILLLSLQPEQKLLNWFYILGFLTIFCLGEDIFDIKKTKSGAFSFKFSLVQAHHLADEETEA